MDARLGLKRGMVALTRAHDQWQRVFAVEQALLREQLGNGLLAIEHVGSTAIPGHFGKADYRHARGRPFVIGCQGVARTS